MRDPGNVILRRALRVALLVPVTYYVVQVLLGLTNASLASAFACFSMLALADLGGPRRERFFANAILGCIGVALVALGSFIGQWQWPVVIATVIIVFAIAFSSVLRGYFAAATAAAILPWVYAATAPPDPSLAGTRALGWAIGAAVATVGSVVLWPMYVRSTLRLRLAEVLDASADVVHAMRHPSERGEAMARLIAANAALHEAYDGRLARPGAGTARDRSLMQAIDETARLITSLEFTHDQDPDIDRGPIDSALNEAVAVCLRDSAEAMRTGAVAPNPAKLDEQREVHADLIAEWCRQQLAAGNSDQVRPGVESSAHIRTISLTAESMAIYVRGAMDPKSRALRPKHGEGAQDVVTFAGFDILEPDARVTPAALLARQFTFRSPWFRTALRTSAAIGLTVYLVTLLGVEHGFWVALGALVALKFDASGTQRTAGQVFVGTILGFVVGSLVVLAAGNHAWPLWLLLPIVTFLAVYTPGAISLIIGQASFTVFVIVLLGITDPGRLNTAEWRLFDVVLGISVSLLVSLFMWPHGVAPMVYRTTRNAIAASTNYLMSAYERIVDGPIAYDGSHLAARQSANQSQRAAEAFDLAYSQQGPGLANKQVMVTAINVATELNYFADVLAALSRLGHLPPSCAASGDALLAAAHRVGTRISALVNVMDKDDQRLAEAVVSDQHHGSLDRLRATIDADMRNLDPNAPSEIPTSDAPVHTDAGHTAMVLVFSLVWITQSVWLADQLEGVVAQIVEPLATAPLPAA